MYFYILSNLYVYIHAYLNWPVRDYIKEYDIDLTDAPQTESDRQRNDVVAP